jgi:hypothetical protein
VLSGERLVAQILYLNNNNKNNSNNNHHHYYYYYSYSFKELKIEMPDDSEGSQSIHVMHSQWKDRIKSVYTPVNARNYACLEE